MKVDDLMKLPWLWQGPHRVTEGDTVTHYELRVAELPDFFVAGQSAEEVREEAAPALRAFLESYVNAREIPPLPQRPNRWVWMMELATPKVSKTPTPVARTQRLKDFQAA